MSERDELLAELRATSGGIDPVLDQAADYARGVKAVQAVVRQQGQVMSAALKNNEALYYTNKTLVARCRELDAENQAFRTQVANLEQQLAVLSAAVAESGGNAWKALYLQSRRVLSLDQYGALSEAELEQNLAQMKRQQAELEAMPERVSKEDYVRATEGEA